MIGTNTSPNDQLHLLVTVLFRLRSFYKEPGNVRVILPERFKTLPIELQLGQVSLQLFHLRPVACGGDQKKIPIREVVSCPVDRDLPCLSVLGFAVELDAPPVSCEQAPLAFNALHIAV